MHTITTFVGIDPGFKGAIALVSCDGAVSVYDMPVTERGTDRQREIDLPALRAIFQGLAIPPLPLVGIEWPTTRPGEGAERSERFGRGKGYLEAFALLHDLPHKRIPPNLWKGRLGIPGKSHKEANPLAAETVERFYPAAKHLIYGPRGGVLDGRADAILIAHYLRVQSAPGMQAVVDRFGKNSEQAWSLLLRGGQRKCMRNA